MFKLYFILFAFITLKFINAKEEIYAGGLTYTQYQAANNNFPSYSDDSFNSQPSGGDGMLGLSVLLGIPAPNGYRSPSSSGYSGYSNGYSAPIYGNAQYTYGPVNQVITQRGVNTGSDYQNFSNNYWGCVNNLRGQYYYSYNLGYYVCDIRANRYGK